jgi:lytic murein transglycosylase
MPRPILSLALLIGLVLTGPVQAAQDFQAFLQGLRPEAQAAGVSRATFDAAFAGVTPDPKVIALAAEQPEFNQTIGAYVASRVTEGRVAQGRKLARQWKPWLDRIERDYGVDRGTVLAIWAMESNFGAGSGNADIVRSLATLACCTGKRPDYFRAELIAALKILEAHDIAPRAMQGSWAGAMGQTQFMPSSFLQYAVDEDGDGHRDIWRSTPDALASIAHYLKLHDWERMAPWGTEVRLAPGFDFAAISAHEGRPVAEWVRLGVAPADGQDFPDSRARAWLLLPSGAKGPAFLTQVNYWAIKTYNISDAYTLSVGHLGDRIRGAGPMAGRWPAGEKALPRAQIQAMQRRLVALGYKLDPIDGKIGPATRAAMRGWQASVGLTADGYPTQAQLQRLGALP